ncbi:hypothetical protein [Pyrobaculum sp.]|uniref:hypothetical protein n=1 Tax=Pyrobaculum sp. TaxID=2004705 RepID=UPI003D0A2CF2
MVDVFKAYRMCVGGFASYVASAAWLWLAAFLAYLGLWGVRLAVVLAAGLAVAAALGRIWRVERSVLGVLKAASLFANHGDVCIAAPLARRFALAVMAVALAYALYESYLLASMGATVTVATTSDGRAVPLVVGGGVVLGVWQGPLLYVAFASAATLSASVFRGVSAYVESYVKLREVYGRAKEILT